MNCNFVDTCHKGTPAIMYALWSQQLLKNKATPFRFNHCYKYKNMYYLGDISLKLSR